MKKDIFIKEISKILKVNSKKLIQIDNFSQIEEYDSLCQLSLLLMYDKFKIDKKIIQELSNLQELSKIISKLDKNSFFKN